MEVLERRNPKERYAIINCTHCKSKLKVFTSDVEFRFFEGGRYINEVNCEVCSEQLFINDESFKYTEDSDAEKNC